MKIENIKVVDKKVIGNVEMNVDMSRIVASSLMRFNKATRNSLTVSIQQHEAENLVLKVTIEELENALNWGPLFIAPLLI